MSVQFNDTSTFKGLVQLYERELGFPRGTIANDTSRLKEFAADVNLVLDDFWIIALKADGRWQLDDSNHTDLPIISTNLVSGRRDYSLTSDSNGNEILEVFKWFVADASGVFSEIHPTDVNTESDTTSFTDGRSASGTPTRYDKLGNSILLDPIPNYSYANGLKGYVNREASYFTHSDTDKKPGVPGIFHRYFAVKPASDYARRNTLDSADRLMDEVLRYEAAIEEYFAARDRDVRKRLTVNSENNK